MLQFWRLRSRHEKLLVALFLCSLPFVRARVQPDGIGYYAYLRSPLINHNFSFATDWNSPPNEMLRRCRTCPPEAKLYWNHPANGILILRLNGNVYGNPITKTGHLPNFYTVGPAILWSPFVIGAHLAVVGADRLGAQIPADGHSWPYVTALTLATAVYGFLGLWLSFQLAKKYLDERWAFWATVGIWFASSLPVYMYLEPSWSHAHSAFCVALFLWYWDRTRSSRSGKQWVVLGLLAGLMLDVYFPNGIFLLAPAVEGIQTYVREWGKPGMLGKQVKLHLLFVLSVVAGFLPMLISRQIVYGNPFTLGMYVHIPWNWRAPAFGPVLFSMEHGLFVWTPILLLAALGLVALWRKEPWLGGVCALMAVAFYGLIAVCPWWDGTIAFGNRYFISLTPIFVLGLAAAFERFAKFWSDSKAGSRRLIPVLVLLIVWNFGMVYQWSTYLLPTPGVVTWDEMLYNQVRVVPGQALRDLETKFQLGHLFHGATERSQENKPVEAP